ncbi:MAG: tRNA (adenosine(37)-N6)-threonylcarbamoyltransferase complex dimerization subunit type 1 TsaB [Bacteroidales bacterium]|nr:tRNA (adenosine(37)-N6)-threonylcarbamoyltransferase complex dimerization subunit type 1 TsaB [Bacteroidales bacterium]
MNKPLFLLIETATNICSCALAEGENIVAYNESNIPNAHSRLLSVFIDNLFHKLSYNYNNLSAVAVSKGPGSYTGLRIGVSTAKGICYALNIPLISIETLQILVERVLTEKNHPNTILPMIDARRMEVYSAIYNSDMQIIKQVSADIITPNIYNDYLKNAENILVCGDGAAKCRNILTDKKYIFDETILLSAKYMIKPVIKKYMNNEFEDIAYFEPYYLKDFIAAPSQVKGLR